MPTKNATIKYVTLPKTCYSLVGTVVTMSSNKTKINVKNAFKIQLKFVLRKTLVDYLWK